MFFYFSGMLLNSRFVMNILFFASKEKDTGEIHVVLSKSIDGNYFLRCEYTYEEFLEEKNLIEYLLLKKIKK